MEEEEEEEGSSDMEVLLISKKVEIQNKPFCFEFKENPHLQYYQISCASSSILVPSNEISFFLDAIDCFLEEKDLSKPKEIKINDNMVWEVSASENSSCIFIPSGDNGWNIFKMTLAEVDRTARVLFPPCQRSFVPMEHPIESANARFDSITSPSAPSSQKENDSIVKSKMIRAGSTTLYIDLNSNEIVGHYLRIAEVKVPFRWFIIIPLSGMERFHEITSYFHKLVNESIASASVNECSSHHISDSHESNGAQVSGFGLQRSYVLADAKSDSKMMSVGSKRFYFNLVSYGRVDHHLKITQVMTNRKSFFIHIPLSVMQQFHEAVSYFHELANESSANTSVKQ